MISTPHTVAFAVAGAACAIAACTDLASRRVPNALTLPLIAAAPVLAAFDGVQAALAAASIAAVMLVLGTFVHAAGVLGGGDVKLLAGVTALAGFPACVDVALYCALCGGVLAVSVAAVRGEIGAVVSRVRIGVTTTLAGHSLALGAAAIGARGTRIPYAVAIGAGFAVAVAGLTVFPFLRIVQ
jgi:Flp pilus assembly protein protease CpaA